MIFMGCIGILMLTCLREVDGCVLSTSNDYEIINDYLKNNVNSDEPRANIEKAKEWLREPESSKSTGHFNFTKTRELIVMLEDIQNKTAKGCPSGFYMLEKIEKALWNGRRSTGENYPLYKIDRILEQLTLKQFESCGLHYFNEFINLNHSLKRNAYDEINKYLVENEPSEDVEANMIRASELLEKTVAAEGESALTDALRLFKILQSVTSENTCNDRSYRIIMRNSLAIPYERRDPSTRRIDRLIKHYLLKNAEICQSFYPKIFINLIRQLDMHSSRSLRVIISESLLGHSHINQTAQLQFEQEFTTPELVALLASRENLKARNTKVGIWFSGPQMLIRAIEYLAAHDEKFFSFSSEQNRRLVKVDKIKLAQLYNKYLESPCRKYLDTVGQMLVHLDFYRNIFHRYISPAFVDHYDKKEATMPTHVNLLLGRGLRRICDRIIARKPLYLKEISQIPLSIKRVVFSQ